jgi:hypothetical protein
MPERIGKPRAARRSSISFGIRRGAGSGVADSAIGRNLPLQNQQQ